MKSFRDSNGMRRIPGRIVREQREKISLDDVLTYTMTGIAGTLAGLVCCLMIHAFPCVYRTAFLYKFHYFTFQKTFPLH